MILGIALPVAREFWNPILLSRFWDGCKATPRMGMPKAPVNPNDLLAPTEYEVRSSGQVTVVDCETISQCVQGRTEEKFGFCVATFIPCHRLADGGRQARPFRGSSPILSHRHCFYLTQLDHDVPTFAPHFAPLGRLRACQRGDF